MALNIPLWFKNKVRYLSLPIGYILYDKSKTKLEITPEIIDNIMPRLFIKPVYVTVTTTYIENFSSVKLYICTINPEKINAFKNHEIENVRFNPSNSKELTLCTYSLR